MSIFYGNNLHNVADERDGTLDGFSGASVGNLRDVHSDTFYGFGGDDLIVSGRGNDVIDGGTGADYMSGQGGNDRYYVDNARDQIVEEVGGGNDIVYTSASYTLTSGSAVETLATISAGAVSDIHLTGNQLDNAIFGNNGNNRIDGGFGNDRLQGNGNGDVFVFSTALNSVANVDLIVDYNTLQDHITLNKAVFTHLTGLAGFHLQDDQFFVGTAAHDASDRIIYNAVTGWLSYDEDGNAAGGVGAVHFATLNGHPPIDHNDFILG